MMSNIKFLLIGTSLSIIPTLTFAQCVATQDCAALGYTETSCNGGKGVKCPFGNQWACFKTENDFCTEFAFDQTCTGENQTPGGKACNGKYCYCECKDGYSWKNGKCQKDIHDGAQGELYYCNGEIIGVKTSDMEFYIAIKDLGKKIWTSADNACRRYSSCGKWRLPTLDQFYVIYNNRLQLNTLLLNHGGDKLKEDETYYTSTPYGSYHDRFDMADGGRDGGWGDMGEYFALPVLAIY